MSSNDIDYFDDGFKTIDGVESDDECIVDDKPKKKLEDMERDELLEIIIKDKENKRRYIKKYQKTEKGKCKTRQASKKYYDANRAKILEKKRLAYLKRKAEKNNMKNITYNN